MIARAYMMVKHSGTARRFQQPKQWKGMRTHYDRSHALKNPLFPISRLNSGHCAKVYLNTVAVPLLVTGVIASGYQQN